MSIQANPAILSDTAHRATRIDSVPSSLTEKAKELEGLFLNTLLSQMFSGTDARGMFGGGYAEETWRSMQTEQYANLITENGGVGIADDIVSNLLAVQEAYQSQQQSSSSEGYLQP